MGCPSTPAFAPDATAGSGFTPFFPDWVVPVQPEGQGRPVFVFPSDHDQRAALAIEARVAAHVGRNRPFWGFGRTAAHRDRVRAAGIAPLGAEYAAQMRAMQGSGPFLLYGICLGGYLAWETAAHLLAAGEEVAGVLFYEVPLRSDFGAVLPLPIPGHIANPWRWSHYFSLHPLPIDLTHVMTAAWHANPWWKPWQLLARGSHTTVIVPGETETAFERREERIAKHVRDWIARAEGTLPGP